jgi:hypothetical protein
VGRTFKKNADYGYKPDHRKSQESRKLEKQLRKAAIRAENRGNNGKKM